MSKDLALYVPKWHIHFFNDEEQSIELNEQQYNAIARVANTDRFIEINGSMYNLSSIKSIVRHREEAYGVIYTGFGLPLEERFHEVGSNPLFREWCALAEPKPTFKVWVTEYVD